MPFDAWRRAPVVEVVADADYDAHRRARDDMGVASVIPPRAGRPTDKPPPTHHRRLMHDGFADGSLKQDHGRRWQSETATA